MSGLALVLLVGFGGAVVAHLARNHLLAAALPGLVSRFEARLGGRVDPGRLALDPGYGLELAGTRLARSGFTLELDRGRVEGLAGSVLVSGARPVRLVGFAGRVAAAGGAGLEVGFDGVVVRRPDQAVEVEGRLTHGGQGLDVRLRVEAAARAEAPWIRLGLAGKGITVPGAGAPLAVGDLDLELEAVGEGEAIRGVGKLLLGRVRLPGLAAWGEAAGALGLPPLPVDLEFDARAGLGLAAAGLEVTGIEVPAGPLRIGGEVRVGAGGELGGALAVDLAAEWLGRAALGVAIRPEGAGLALAVEPGGSREAPRVIVRLREPVAVERAGAALRVERAGLEGEVATRRVRLLETAGVLRVPDPGRGTWVLPLQAAGAPAREGEAVRAEVRVKDGFLQPEAGGPPRWPPVQAAAEVGLGPAGFDGTGTVTLGALGAAAVDGVEVTGAVLGFSGAGPWAAPAWRAGPVGPVELRFPGGCVELARAELRGDPGAPPRLAGAAGLVRAPGPGGGGWLLPVAFAGGEAGAGELLRGRLTVKEGFLQPAGGGAPVAPPLSLEAELVVKADGAFELTGPLSTARSTLHAALRRAAGGGLDGTRLHGQLAVEDLGAWIPAPVRELVFEDVPLSCQLEVAGPPAALRVTGDFFSPRLLRGSGTLKARAIGLAPPAAELELTASGLRIERVPTDAAGGTAVAPFLEAAVSGKVAISLADGAWTARGPVEFDEANLLFLEAGSKAAVAQGWPPLPRRPAGKVPARLGYADGRLVLSGLDLEVGPLSARGEVAFGGKPAFTAGLDLALAAAWLRRGRGPLAPAPGVDSLALKLVAGEAPGWGLALRAPVRLVAPGLRLDLAAARVADGVLERAEGTAEVEGPGGRSFVLPLAYVAAEAPPGAGSRLEGTVSLRDGRLREAGGDRVPIPPVEFSGPLRLGADGALSLSGNLAAGSSRLTVRVRRAPDGELAGTRLVGSVDLDELGPLLPAGLELSAPPEHPPALDLELDGTPGDLGLNAKLHAGALRIGGGEASGLPRLLLGDLEADLALDSKACELRRASARFTGGRLEASGTCALDEDPVRYEVELRLDGIRVEKLVTDGGGERGLEGKLEGALSGELALRGKGTGLCGLHGRGELTLAQPRYLFLREAGQGAGLGPLPVEGKGRARASLRLVREELHLEEIDAGIEGARIRGEVRVTAAGELGGMLEAKLASALLARSPLLALPAAAIDSLQVPVGIGGTLAEPRFDADVMAAVERLLGRSTVGRTMKGAVDTLWATFGRDTVQPGPELDRILARILAGGPGAEATLEKLIATGVTPSEIEELLEDYRDRHSD